jgi:hypothetical protein
MALITPSYITVNPNYMEPGIILPYSQASGAFETIAEGQPLARLSEGDLYVYMKKIDIRTKVSSGQAAYNSLPSISVALSNTTTTTRRRPTGGACRSSRRSASACVRATSSSPATACCTGSTRPAAKAS